MSINVIGLFFIFINRSILAAVHFNYNVCRKNKVDADGKKKLKVTYPKFKEGEATVREIKVAQNYGNLLVLNSGYNNQWDKFCDVAYSIYFNDVQDYFV